VILVVVGSSPTESPLSPCGYLKSEVVGSNPALRLLPLEKSGGYGSNACSSAWQSTGAIQEVGRSSNGRTPVSKTGNGGSKPSRPANHLLYITHIGFIMSNFRALYFGCWEIAGHYLHDEHGQTLWNMPDDFPWTIGILDGGFLHNGKREDVPDGRVYWTCGGKSTDDMWYAFFWWDRSVDGRGQSNSGFYVHGFKRDEAEAAFEYACKVYPQVVTRQKFPLVLQR
jgi:hypothetical protein